MYRLVSKPSSRSFSTCSQLLTDSRQISPPKLKHQLQKAVLTSKKPINEYKQNIKLQNALKSKNLRQVKNASAISLLSKLLKKEIPKDEIIGPNTEFTSDDFDKIMKQNNFRLKYKVLGTSGNQLKDSVKVANDVTKFLKKDELDKAIGLTRLSRFQGIYSYGLILEYLINHGKLNSSIEFYNKIKKWGYSPDGRILNILISGLSNYKDHNGESGITSNQAEKLYFILVNSMKNKDLVNTMHINSAMKAFRMAQKPELSVELFSKVDQLSFKESIQLKPDLRTYTELFSNLKHLKDYNEAVTKAEHHFEKLQNNRFIKIDSILIRSYSSIFIFSDDLRLKARAVSILRQWFRICKKEKMNETVEINKARNWKSLDGDRKLSAAANLDEILLPLEKININKTKRFDANDTIFYRYGYLCDLLNIKNDSLKLSKEQDVGDVARLDVVYGTNRLLKFVTDRK